MGNFFNSREQVSCSRGTVLHAVSRYVS